MTQIVCEHCSAAIDVPEGYDLPKLKCSKCGGLQKNPFFGLGEPTYKILGSNTRSRAKSASGWAPQVQDYHKKNQNTAVPAADLSDEGESDSDGEASKGPRLAAPAIASAQAKAQHQTMKTAVPSVQGPISERGFLKDALGEYGMNNVIQLVSAYADYFDESAKSRSRAQVIRSLMRTKVTAEVAARAVEYAENSDEVREFLRDTYKISLYKSLALFAPGLIVFLIVHLLVHPGVGMLLLLQLPFALGFVMVINSLLYLLGIYYPVLHSKGLHYGVLLMSIAAILACIAFSILP